MNDICRHLQTSEDAHRYLPGSLDIFRYLWVSVGIFRYLRVSEDVCGYLKISQDTRRYLMMPADIFNFFYTAIAEWHLHLRGIGTYYYLSHRIFTSNLYITYHSPTPRPIILFTYHARLLGSLHIS